MIYDALFATDANGEIKPQMVGNCEVAVDKMTYMFTLREGLSWHDGNPVMAEGLRSRPRFQSGYSRNTLEGRWVGKIGGRQERKIAPPMQVERRAASIECIRSPL